MEPTLRDRVVEIVTEAYDTADRRHANEPCLTVAAVVEQVSDGLLWAVGATPTTARKYSLTRSALTSAVKSGVLGSSTGIGADGREVRQYNPVP